VLLYGGAVAEATLGTLLGLASVGVLVAVLLMAWMVLRSRGRMEVSGQFRAPLGRFPVTRHVARLSRQLS
jgi:hypothetical protein